MIVRASARRLPSGRHCSLLQTALFGSPAALQCCGYCWDLAEPSLSSCLTTGFESKLLNWIQHPYEDDFASLQQ